MVLFGEAGKLQKSLTKFPESKWCTMFDLILRGLEIRLFSFSHSGNAPALPCVRTTCSRIEIYRMNAKKISSFNQNL